MTDGSVKYDQESDFLQFFNGEEWINLLKIYTSLKAFIIYGSNLNADTGAFTVYFVNVSYSTSDNKIQFMKYDDSISFTLSTHKTYTFDNTILDTYGLQKLSYNARSTPYNTYIICTVPANISDTNIISISCNNDISDISSTLFPINMNTLTSVNANTTVEVSSLSSNLTNKIIGFGLRTDLM